MSINITKHGLKRYIERFRGETNIQERELMINSQKEQLESEINAMYDNSKVIYKGELNDNEEATFRLVDNIIIICDAADTKVITLFRINFGFSRAIDKQIIDSLIKELNDYDELYAEELCELDSKRDHLLAQRESLKMEIVAQEKVLESLQESKKLLDTEIKGIETKKDLAEKDRNECARKLVYSVEFRAEQEAYRTCK